MNVPDTILPMDKLHNEAMELADRAYSAARKGKVEDVQRHYEAAFELEKKAAMMLVNDYDLEPTRSVYFRSAASLILSLPKISATQFREAERMIAFGLSGYPPIEIAEELREVLEELKVKYYQQEEVIKQGEAFSATGKFVALNLKTRQFEFLGVDQQVIKGNYFADLNQAIRKVSFTKKYAVTGWLHKKANIWMVNDIEINH